jgi:predicted dehydrogenase
VNHIPNLPEKGSIYNWLVDAASWLVWIDRGEKAFYPRRIFHPAYSLTMPPLTIAILGCGARGRAYAGIAASFGDRYHITAAADPVAARREAITSLFPADGIRTFSSSGDFFAAGKLADVLIIATQDADHFEHASTALRAGYDILLEKPAAETLSRCEELDALARSLDRRIGLCFVLRYTPFYSTAKELITSGRLGRIISIRAGEGVEPFHQAHSFVRGHWSRSANSTPMIVAKCSHDTDLLCWLASSAPAHISSYGGLDWFRRENTPTGAPPRCSDGCPAAPQCPFDAHRYLGDKRRWLEMVMDGAEKADDAATIDFLKSSPWGRCVYQCDNDAVDHQVVAVEMLNGVTASLTMTAFDHGRTLEIHGTRASLRGGSPLHEAGTPELWLRDHASGKIEAVELAQPSTSDAYVGHGGGDWGIMDALERMFRGPDRLPPGLDGMAGHRLAFLAEKSRLTDRGAAISRN